LSPRLSVVVIEPVVKVGQIVAITHALAIIWKHSNLVEFCSGQEILSGFFLKFSTECAKGAIPKVTRTKFGGAPSFGDCWGAHLLSIVTRLGFWNSTTTTGL
jgi:hypothetical protein